MKENNPPKHDSTYYRVIEGGNLDQRRNVISKIRAIQLTGDAARKLGLKPDSLGIKLQDDGTFIYSYRGNIQISPAQAKEALDALYITEEGIKAPPQQGN